MRGTRHHSRLQTCLLHLKNAGDRTVPHSPVPGVLEHSICEGRSAGRARGTGGGHRIGCRENGPTAALPNALKRRMPRVRILYASPWGVFHRRVRHEPHQCPAGAAALRVLPLPSGSALPANSTLSADSPSHSRPDRPGWTDRPSGDSGTGRSHRPCGPHGSPGRDR